MRYWKCIGNEFNQYFTIDKIYSTDDNGYEIKDDKNDKYPTQVTEMCSAKFEEVKEEGEDKMEDLRELIKPCYLLVLENDIKVKTVETQNGIVGQYQYGRWDELNTMINEVKKIYGFSTHGARIGEFSEEDRKLIYEKKSPTQLKLEELEKKQREIDDEMEKLRKEL